jgi:hypothetical protein
MMNLVFHVEERSTSACHRTRSLHRIALHPCPGPPTPPTPGTPSHRNRGLFMRGRSLCATTSSSRAVPRVRYRSQTPRARHAARISRRSFHIKCRVQKYNSPAMTRPDASLKLWRLEYISLTPDSMGVASRHQRKATSNHIGVAQQFEPARKELGSDRTRGQ